MRRFLPILCVLLFGVVAFAEVTSDVSPLIGPIQSGDPSDAMWDVVQSFNCQLTYSQLQLGAAYAGGYFWVCGGGMSSATTTDNKYYRFNNAGVLIDSFAQPTNSGWGWRDMAFDGTYLYAGCEVSTIVAFNPTTGALVPTMNFPKPAAAAIVRALAYDPATDHFWTGNFGSNIIEFDRSGTVIWSGSPTPLTAVYGMAWDPYYSAGTTLWIFDQTGTPGTVFRRFDPATHTMTSETHTVPLPSGVTSGIAGGAEMSNTYSSTYRAMVCLGQGTPYDYVAVVEMEQQVINWNLNVTMTPIGGPIVIPAQGGSFNFDASVVNNGSQTPFVVWARIKNPDGTYTAPILGPVTINPPTGSTVSRTRTQNVPGTWPSGLYYEIGYAGGSVSYPAADADSFSWTKSADFTGGPFVHDATCYGEAFPGEVINMPATHTVLSNFPNPFNPSTTIRFTLGTAGNADLTVYDMNGREVTRLVNGYRQAGVNEVTFDGSNLASGVYVCVLNANGQTSTAKMMLMK